MPTTFLEWAQAISLLAAAVAAIGLPTWYLGKRNKREEAQVKGYCLILKGIRKIGQLAYANAVATVEGKVNGEMDKAMDGYSEYMDELNEHIDGKATN